MSAHISLKLTTKGSFTGKEIWKFSIFKAFFLKQKRKSVTKMNEFDKFGTLLPCSAIYCLEFSARLWLKIPTECSFRKKKTMKIEFFRLLF